MISDEAVGAAARVLHWQMCLVKYDHDEAGEHGDFYRDAALRALTAAAPLILAARDEQLRGLVETWREWAHVANATAAHTFTECANHLAALLDGGSDE